MMFGNPMNPARSSDSESSDSESSDAVAKEVASLTGERSFEVTQSHLKKKKSPKKLKLMVGGMGLNVFDGEKLVESHLYLNMRRWNSDNQILSISTRKGIVVQFKTPDALEIAKLIGDQAKCLADAKMEAKRVRMGAIQQSVDEASYYRVVSTVRASEGIELQSQPTGTFLPGQVIWIPAQELVMTLRCTTRLKCAVGYVSKDLLEKLPPSYALNAADSQNIHESLDQALLSCRCLAENDATKLRVEMARKWAESLNGHRGNRSISRGGCSSGDSSGGSSGSGSGSSSGSEDDDEGEEDQQEEAAGESLVTAQAQEIARLEAALSEQAAKAAELAKEVERLSSAAAPAHKSDESSPPHRSLPLQPELAAEDAACLPPELQVVLDGAERADAAGDKTAALRLFQTFATDGMAYMRSLPDDSTKELHRALMPVLQVACECAQKIRAELAAEAPAGAKASGAADTVTNDAAARLSGISTQIAAAKASDKPGREVEAVATYEAVAREMMGFLKAYPEKKADLMPTVQGLLARMRALQATVAFDKD